METIGVTNLRGFSETTELTIKPLTVLLGKNSSGKSSFLRLFPLLRQSVESRTVGPVLWYGPYVDYGQYADVISRNAKNDRITLSFTINVPKQAPSRFGQPLDPFLKRELAEDTNIKAEIELYSDRRKATRASRVRITIFDYVIDARISNDGRLAEFYVDDCDLTDVAAGSVFVQRAGIFPVMIPENRQSETVGSRGMPRMRWSRFEDQLLDKLDPFVHGKLSTESRIDLLSCLRLSPKNNFFGRIAGTKKGGEIWNRRVREVANKADNELGKDALALRNAAVASFFPSLLSFVSEHTYRVFNDCAYIGPIRATAERFYRLQDFAVDEVDHTGANLPMFLRNLSDKDRENLTSWMSEMFGISVVVREREAHLSLAIKEDSSGADLNIADVGFGFSQILPVVVQLWQRTRGRTSRRLGLRARPTVRRMPVILAVEQPELHLHPEMQAKIGRFLSRMVSVAKLSRIDMRLIIETHSEHIINQVGACVADGEIAPDDVDIDVFYKGETSSHLQVASFDEDGFLKNWPYGFFRSSLF